ncbi:aminopeptidase P family protein [Pseudorhodobacter aquimaris]|uniref:aminopeptidase P family protein n=1 Tax=Pseudorhodobacter aquimaris TaxID=687412 RepID=UPI00067B7C66|nr:aminopeptidase P family protein [Pseudorhodobacter aquimaris]
MSFQNFSASADPSQGPTRLQALRKRLAAEGLDGFIIPRADAHQGENVAPRDDRLQWLTGFTGSAGFCIVLPDVAGVFIDGRYRTQVKTQVDLAHFTPVPWPDIKPGPWIADHLEQGRIGFDPWLHTPDEIAAIERALEGLAITLCPTANMVDAIWPDQPAPPMGRAFVHPDALAGKTSAQKRTDLGAQLQEAGQGAAIITLPDSLCWLLNIRGRDVPRTPVLHGFSILFADGRVSLFTAPEKLDEATRAHLGDQVTIRPAAAFVPALRSLQGPVRVDRATAPLAVSLELNEPAWGDDPCRLPKACKTDAEIAGARAAHLRDGAAMVEFLCWLEDEAPKGQLTEIDVVQKLESCRRATNQLHDLSFDTICGAGEHGAIMHYRVTDESNRPVTPGALLLVDSGAQYVDGTTDITRTMAIGPIPAGGAEAFTRVLQGMIALSRARWPNGLSGRDLDPIARYPLWLAGMDFNHGTGHGVGAFLSVHEGPQRISRMSEVALRPGMIVSNEPGYYREGAFGIRLENLIVVTPAAKLLDDRDQLCFETLTFVPFDRRLVDLTMLAPGERDWLNAYHAEVASKIAPLVSAPAAEWLARACAPL